jgi:hypothetical protein
LIGSSAATPRSLARIGRGNDSVHTVNKLVALSEIASLVLAERKRSSILHVVAHGRVVPIAYRLNTVATHHSVDVEGWVRTLNNRPIGKFRYLVVAIRVIDFEFENFARERG